MKIIVFGASGRVGSCVVEQAIAAGHEVTAFVRAGRSVKGSPGVKIVEGDVRVQHSVDAAIDAGFDVVVNAVGAPNLQTATIVTDSVRAILAGMQAAGLQRYLGVSGTAEMSPQTSFGKLTIGIFRLTPVGNPIRDHDRAYALLAASTIRWTLTGCGYIADGPARGKYRTSLSLTGGLKQIHPGDVADFLVREIASEKPEHLRRVVGLWY